MRGATQTLSTSERPLVKLKAKVSIQQYPIGNGWLLYTQGIVNNCPLMSLISNLLSFL